jgi:YfiH family protein
MDGGIAALVASDLEAEGFLIAFTERAGGVSRPPFGGLNLSLSSGDAQDRVAENRRRACHGLGIDRFVLGQQVHGAAVATVTAEHAGRGFEDPTAAIPGIDGLVTTEHGMALAVLVADCVPIAMASPREGRLGVVHAGWRGIATGVVRAAVDRFDRPEAVQAVIGPAIGPDHYEVAEEVAGPIATAAGHDGVVIHREGRMFADLPAAVASILRSSGVESVEMAGVCTACHPEAFFSYRRDGPTGRQALVALRR